MKNVFFYLVFNYRSIFRFFAIGADKLSVAFLEFGKISIINIFTFRMNPSFANITSYKIIVTVIFISFKTYRAEIALFIALVTCCT